MLLRYEDLEDLPAGSEGFAVVVAVCGTNRVDDVDKDLLDDLREKKGTGLHTDCITDSFRFLRFYLSKFIKWVLNLFY